MEMERNVELSVSVDVQLERSEQKNSDATTTPPPKLIIITSESRILFACGGE
jgi:hypothetical protein